MKKKMNTFKANVKLKKLIWNGKRKIPAGETIIDEECFDGKYHEDTAEVKKIALSEKELQEEKEAEEADLKKEKGLQGREDSLDKRETELNKREELLKKKETKVEPKETPKNQNLNPSFPAKK